PVGTGRHSTQRHREAQRMKSSPTKLGRCPEGAEGSRRGLRYEDKTSVTKDHVGSPSGLRPPPQLRWGREDFLCVLCVLCVLCAPLCLCVEVFSHWPVAAEQGATHDAGLA